MSVDSRGRHAAQLTHRLAERRGPVPPFALVQRRRWQRAWRRASAVAVIILAGVVTVTALRQHQGEPVAPASGRLGKVAAVIRVGGPLTRVRTGTDAVWVQRDSDHSAVRVDPRSNQVVARLPLGAPGSELGAVGAGGLWFTHRGQGTVTKVDPATGRILATIGVPDAARRAGGMTVAVGAGGVWVANNNFGESQEHDSVVRIDPATNKVVATVKVDTAPDGIAVSGGAVMVVPYQGAAYQIDPVTNRVVATFAICTANPAADGNANAIAYGAGAFWVACGDGALTRIDPVARRVVATVQLGVAAGAVVADADGVWVATADGTVKRIDPQTNTIVGSLPVGGLAGQVFSLAASPGAVWLAAGGDGLTRIAPDG
jgi:virginiamycin B lyase